MKDVGTELGINEGAARKRVARATEKLRAIFAHRGLNVSTSALADSISAHAVEAAPDGLAESAVLVAFAPNSANQSARAAVNETLRAMTVAAWQNDVLLVVFWLLVSGILVVAAKGISLH
jgi:hypothetical protein